MERSDRHTPHRSTFESSYMERKSELDWRNDLEEPAELRNFLTRDVIVTSANCSFLAVVEISSYPASRLPLHTCGCRRSWAPSPAIGTIMSFSGIDGVFTLFLFSRMTEG